MRAVKAGLLTRLLLPALLLVGGLSAMMVVALVFIARSVREDYHEFTVLTVSGNVGFALEVAAHDLTTARLEGNPVVTEAKQRTVAGEIGEIWSRGGLGGVISGTDGSLVLTTLDPAATRAVAAQREPGYCTERVNGVELHCSTLEFPLWGWVVTTVGRHDATAVLRREIAFLPLFFGAGAVVLAVALLGLLWVQLRQPLGAMVAALDEDREVPATGTAEFDRIGAAVNGALERVRERSRDLSRELDRRRRAEASLQEKEEHIRLLLQSTAEGIYGVNTAGVCTFCNPSCLRQLGLVREEDLLGRNMHDLVHHTRADGSPYPEADCRIYLAYREARGVHVADEVFWRADGTSFPVEYWSHPVVQDGRVMGAVVAFVDISERTVLQQQLLQAQKMEAIGRFAGGIAHDFNNMLMAIVGYASLGRELAGRGTRQEHYCDQVLAAAEKAGELTWQILAFSRKQVMQMAPVDVNGVILGMGKIIARLLGEDIQVSLNLSGGRLVAVADKGQLEQVLMNLCTNARDAMPGGGRLVIATRAMACDREAAAVHGLDAPGHYALIEVADTGGGMDERTRQHIFEPFFTTKETGKGTGLGLSIVHGIIRQHHGQIGVYSEVGKGSTFRLYLPLTSAEVEESAVPRAPEPVRGGTETVLLAEDNENVRELAQNVLQGAGYRVLAACDGAEAVQVFAANADAVALCLFDVVMPRMSGKEALEAIRARCPGVRALFMSGHAAGVLGDEAGGGLQVPVLPKPLLPTEMLRRVRQALDA
ncbi:MAG TPA: ATP-binding protein [bacterium]